jgi:hypothetical protein
VKYAKEEGIEFPHIIGPQTPHKYHPDSKPKIEEFITEAVKEGSISYPRQSVHLTTYSLIYPEALPRDLNSGFVIERMERQWERANVDLQYGYDGTLSCTTKNVAVLRILINATPNAATSMRKYVIDGQEIGMQLGVRVEKVEGHWTVLPDKPAAPAPQITKGLAVCGPIDHAFMSSFVFVEPTGQPLNEAVGTWSKAEFMHAKDFWRKVFRGDAPVQKDTALSKQDIANSNLVLWGDPASNAVLKQIIDKLPLKWTKDTLEFKGMKYDATHHAPVMIFPNPLNPTKYVVINSGPTFREEALLNNSDQTPKLPDWAIIDINTPPDAKWPGLVVDAGFFDEQWKP